MKPLKIYPSVFIICGLALFANINAQEKSSIRHPDYKFEFKHVTKDDTIHTLYCAMPVSDLANFEKVSLIYNNKTKIYNTKNVLKDKSEDYSIEGKYVFFLIRDYLSDPFVIIEGVDKVGHKYDINERNAKGKVINSKEEKVRWNKSVSRIDSMDYVRQFDGVYTGGDGRPRYRDRNGSVYIIEKDHTHPE
jgi:hypothetical protein